MRYVTYFQFPTHSIFAISALFCFDSQLPCEVGVLSHYNLHLISDIDCRFVLIIKLIVHTTTAPCCSAFVVKCRNSTWKIGN